MREQERVLLGPWLLNACGDRLREQYEGVLAAGVEHLVILSYAVKGRLQTGAEGPQGMICRALRIMPVTHVQYQTFAVIARETRQGGRVCYFRQGQEPAFDLKGDMVEPFDWHQELG